MKTPLVHRYSHVLALIVLSAFISFAQAPGSIDATFGAGGMFVSQPPLADDPTVSSAMEMVFQTDGKIVVLARAANIASTFQNVLVRYTADGQLDATFGSGGFVYIPSGAIPSGFARRLIKQNVGGQERFVIATGDKCGGVDCTKVQRYTTAGVLDPGFGTGGVSTVSYPGGAITAAAVQSDQKLLFGSLQNPLLRLNANGSPDSTFGTNGISSFNDSRMLISSMAVQPDGKIVTAGSYIGGASPDIYAARFTSTGRSDASFGSQGKVVIDFAGLDDLARALAIDASGNIIVAGSANIAGPMSAPEGWDAVIVRLTSKGVMDKTFGTNGRAAFLNIGGGEDSFQGITIQSNGKIVAIGKGTLVGNSPDILVARYNANGTLDPTFHGNGWNVTDIYGEDDLGRMGLIQFDAGCSCSKLVVVARASLTPSPQYIVGLRYSL